MPDTSCNNLNPDISTYWNDEYTGRTNFARLQTYLEFKSVLNHDAFRHFPDEGLNESAVIINELEVNTDEEGEDEDERDAEEQSDDAEDEEDEEEGDKDQTGVNVVPHDNEADTTCFLLRPMRKNPVRQTRRGKKKNIACDEANIPTPSASSSVETESGIPHTRSDCCVVRRHRFIYVFSQTFFSPGSFLVDTLVSFAGTVEEPLSLSPIRLYQESIAYVQLTLLQRGFDP